MRFSFLAGAYPFFLTVTEFKELSSIKEDNDLYQPHSFQPKLCESSYVRKI